MLYIILKELKGSYVADGDDVYRAIKKKCQEGSVSFKIIKIKPYLDANGYDYDDTFLNQLKVNNPKER